MKLTRKLWLLWFALAMAGSSAMVGAMIYGGPLRSQLLIGKTTSGHHQIELACESCHQPFGGKAAMQQACVSCHGAELKLANDSHPAKKFTDPRNADRLEKLNATLCVTCHREHNPQITGAMGVTLPSDYCVLCHKDVGKDRVSHQGLPFNGCAAAGCHNFHDNRALYEDFLAKHATEPALNTPAILATPVSVPSPAAAPLPREAANAPLERMRDQILITEWHDTAHAKAGVNCKGCHAPKDTLGRDTTWADQPAMTACAGCHAPEARTFTEGKHGMRLRDGMLTAHPGLGGLLTKAKLPPMRPELARLPMSGKVHGVELTCTTCHGAHRFDVIRAQVDACQTCHADDHTRAYAGSPHHAAWLAEVRGERPKGSGATCATCHMPRLETEDEYGRKHIAATHNQNDTLRPNEKMARPVCLSCHGLQFTLDNLADPGVIAANFAKPSSRRVPSIDWVIKRAKDKQAK